MHQVVAPAVELEAGVGRAVLESGKTASRWGGCSGFSSALRPRSTARICSSKERANRPSMSWLQSSTNTKPPLRTYCVEVLFFGRRKLHQPVPRQVAERVAEQLGASRGPLLFPWGATGTLVYCTSECSRLAGMRSSTASQSPEWYLRRTKVKGSRHEAGKKEGWEDGAKTLPGPKGGFRARECKGAEGNQALMPLPTPRPTGW